MREVGVLVTGVQAADGCYEHGDLPKAQSSSY